MKCVKRVQIRLPTDNMDSFVYWQLGYAVGSLLSSSWYVSKRSTVGDLHLCGREGVETEALIREWIEFYTLRLRSSPWQQVSKEKVLTVLEVITYTFLSIIAK